MTATTTLIFPVSRMKSRLPSAKAAGKDIARSKMIVKNIRVLKNFMFPKIYVSELSPVLNFLVQIKRLVQQPLVANTQAGYPES